MKVTWPHSFNHSRCKVSFIFSPHLNIVPYVCHEIVKEQCYCNFQSIGHAYMLTFILKNVPAAHTPSGLCGNIWRMKSFTEPFKQWLYNKNLKPESETLKKTFINKCASAGCKPGSCVFICCRLHWCVGRKGNQWDCIDLQVSIVNTLQIVWYNCSFFSSFSCIIYVFSYFTGWLAKLTWNHFCWHMGETFYF